MARQIDPARVPRLYAVRITGTVVTTGEPYLRVYGPYFARGHATTQAARARLRRPYGVDGVAVETVSAPVGEWTVES